MSVIHYDTRKRCSMPLSGAHVICSCGKWFQENYTKDKNRYTEDMSRVTCKNCLKHK